ncbi:C (U1) putative protein [Kolongo virus]|uniref:Uncharacterized protein n=1 Tax=Kolongo virus TaxID=380436 RepID=A0AAE8XDE2_9RHAB|nr:C (U1) putative protein [Kolongo virus]UAU42881.1 C (U1) putative protein [Kolongo virus]
MRKAEEAILILEECTDLSCHQHPEEVHLLNLFKWGKLMFHQILEKIYQIWFGVMSRLMRKFFRTHTGTRIMREELTSRIRNRYQEEA